jgi:hypothetical protein
MGNWKARRRHEEKNIGREEYTMRRRQKEKKA